MNPELPPIPPQHAKPKVLFWFKAYVVFFCIMYFVCALLGIILLLVDPTSLDMSSSETKIVGAFLFLLGGGLFVVCLVPLVVKPRPWVWIYDLVVICLGMTSGCTLPMSVPLLIYWLKPEVKRHFEGDSLRTRTHRVMLGRSEPLTP